MMEKEVVGNIRRYWCASDKRSVSARRRFVTSVGWFKFGGGCSGGLVVLVVLPLRLPPSQSSWLLSLLSEPIRSFEIRCFQCSIPSSTSVVWVSCSVSQCLVVAVAPSSSSSSSSVWLRVLISSEGKVCWIGGIRVVLLFVMVVVVVVVLCVWAIFRISNLGYSLLV